MVPHPRAPLGSPRLRVLNAPTPILVQADATGKPTTLQRRDWPRPRPVTIVDRWRIDDEWWRERPIARLYYTVAFPDGATMTIFHNLLAGTGHEQRG